MSLLKDFFTTCHAEHDKIALIDGSRTCTYQELNIKSDALAQLILKQNWTATTHITSIGTLYRTNYRNIGSYESTLLLYSL